MTPRSPRKLRPVLVAVSSLLLGLPALAVNAQPASSPGQPAMTGLQRAAEASLPAMAAPGTGATGAFNAGALDAPTMTINLPDGRVLQAVRQQTNEDRANGKRSWVGTFPDEPGSMVAYSTVRGVTTGFISYGTETWEMLPSRGGKHVLYRVDQRKLPTAELEVLPTTPIDHDGTVTVSDYGLGTTTAAAGGSVIDLLVVYTPKARAAYGQATLASMIENAVAMANQAYQNSKVAVTLRIVGLQEISYVESGLRSSYDNLRGTNDGKMDSVHALRNNVGADVVTLISEDSGGCGIAGVMTKVSTAYAPEAFSVVKTTCLSQHSLAHEIGHNMGNRHDRDSTNDTGAYPYSYGFRRCTTDGSGFRTVMAYSCSGGKRVAWFSNPNVYYNGHATGIAYESNPSKSADNARSMNNAAATVAAFRAGTNTTSPSPSPSITVPAAPSALSALASSASAIDLRWTDNSGNESGFIVERSSNGVDFTQIATLGANATSYASNGLAASTLYYHRVRSYNSAGNSTFSNTASTKTAAASSLEPAKPANVTASDRTDGSALVTWSDMSNNESGFQVRRYKWDAPTSSWGSRMVVSVAANATRLIDYSGPGKFRYSVRAVNSSGKSSYVGPMTVSVTKK